MTQLTIKVRGELVRSGLQDLAAELPRVGRQQIRTAMNRIYREVSSYPKERPGQTYKRTGRLFYSWKIDEVKSGYKIENTATYKGKAYAVYVVGDAYGQRQAWMHQGRWTVLRDAADAEVEKLPDEIEQEIVMVARRNNL